MSRCSISQVAFCCLTLSIVAPASAERIEQQTPSGVELTAPVGGIVWERASFDGAPGVTTGSPIQASWGSLENVSLPAGSNLIVIREKKLKACRQQTVSTFGGISASGWADCVIDVDGDGRFEKVSFNEVAGAKDIVPPVSYTRGTVALTGGKTQSFRQTITYLGKTGTDIRLSYREFTNDLARPAFTEDLTLPAPSEFPQAIQIKSITLTVTAVGHVGLSYRLN